MPTLELTEKLRYGCSAVISACIGLAREDLLNYLHCSAFAHDAYFCNISPHTRHIVCRGSPSIISLMKYLVSRIPTTAIQ